MLALAVTLRFNPPLGKPLRYTVVNRTTRTMGPAGSTTVIQTIPLTLTALSRKGGGTTLESRTGTVRIDVPANSPLARAKDAMVKGASNQASTMVVDALGKPSRLLRAGAAAPVQMGGAQGVAFPARPVRVGESWTVDLDLARMLPAGGAVKATGRIPMRYTLKALGKGTATIAVAIDGSAAMTAVGQPVTLRMKGGGLLHVDPLTGLVADSHLAMDTSTTLGAQGSFSQRTDVTMRRA